MNQRLTRIERITRQAEIDACYRQGKRLSGPLLRLHVRPNGRPFARLAISIPGRIVPKAVERTRWKRLIREVFRLNKGAIANGFDIVAVPTRPPGTLLRQEVESAFLRLITRLK